MKQQPPPPLMTSINLLTHKKAECGNVGDKLPTAPIAVSVIGQK